MTKKIKTLVSVLFAVFAVLTLLFALFLCSHDGGLLSFIFSCPFWSTTILLFLATFRLYRVALFGFIGALVVGGLAFVSGFIGPIIFMPNANQGPLLGIFITGPLGIIVGTILGVLTAIIMKQIRQQKDSQDGVPPPAI